jgi:hypothetical protein
MFIRDWVVIREVGVGGERHRAVGGQLAGGVQRGGREKGSWF